VGETKKKNSKWHLYNPYEVDGLEVKINSVK